MEVLIKVTNVAERMISGLRDNQQVREEYDNVYILKRYVRQVHTSRMIPKHENLCRLETIIRLSVLTSQMNLRAGAIISEW